MATGKYRIPKEFQDEDKYFRFFTPKQLLIGIVAFLFCVGIVTVLTFIHLAVIGWIIAVVIMAGALAVPRFTMPADRYLIGGGMPLTELLIRFVVKKLPSNKKVYILNADSLTEEEE